MPSRRTKPYHLYLVFLKLPGSRSARASCTCGKPANGLVSLVTAGAVPSLGAVPPFGVGAASPGGIVNGGGLDDRPGSTVLLGGGGAWTVSFGGGNCPKALAPTVKATPTVAASTRTRIANANMITSPRETMAQCSKLEQLSTQVGRRLRVDCL